MRIIHVLANGTELPDITDHVVKIDEAETFYEKLNSINWRRSNDENQNQIMAK